MKCDNSGTGFGFLNVVSIKISGLTLLGCGELRNSTMINESSNSVMLFRATLHFVSVNITVIDNIVINNSIGIGVAMCDVTGATVTNSIFRNNSFNHMS